MTKPHKSEGETERREGRSQAANLNSLLITLVIGLLGYFGNRIVVGLDETKTAVAVDAVILTNHEGRISTIETKEGQFVTRRELDNRLTGNHN